MYYLIISLVIISIVLIAIYVVKSGSSTDTVTTESADKEFKIECEGIDLELQSTFLGDKWRVEKHATRLAKSYHRTVVIYEKSNSGWKRWGVVQPDGQVTYEYEGS